MRMLKLAEQILSKVPKVEYADVRIVEQSTEDIATKDGIVEALHSGQSLGYNVRVLHKEVWGFAASNDFSNKGIDATIKKAMEIANSSAKTPIKEDPFKVPLEEKLDLLLKADKAQKVSPKVVITQSSYQANREKKYFVSTLGSKIEQEIVWTGAGIEASAVSGAEFQNRSYPNSFRGQNQTRGFELVRELELEKHGGRVAKEAVDLLTADLCPSGEFDLILDSNQLALQIHESCG